MIFVTLGSQKFQFNRLLKEVDRLLEMGTIQEEVVAQVGYSDYRPINYPYRPFMDGDEFGRLMGKCDVVMAHGGTGTIMTALKLGKKVIAVPRLSMHGEHVDDHQTQLIEQFLEARIISGCRDVGEIGKTYEDLGHIATRDYQTNTDKIIESIEAFCLNMTTGDKKR